MNSQQWQEEVEYIQSISPSYLCDTLNNDTECYRSYCKMRARHAYQDGEYRAAAEILAHLSGTKFAYSPYSETTGVFIEAQGGTCWSHVSCADGQRSRVGPRYKTKEEALADHASYLVRAGWLPEQEV